MGRGRGVMLHGRIGSRRVQAGTCGFPARCGFIVIFRFGLGAVGGRIIAFLGRIRLPDWARRISPSRRTGNRRRP
jgi:hypothetical protein